ncbi:hypothetical protein NX02_08840 [Sphingomonas sanxanigenens DSM 19645 = NX02]|uniref:EF-hand domain-containing protein n=2 Tax=Sphingomonas sanxanigenens TaxID=397260 RepID=W0A8V1_9SPHN|nr:hypothetical protein NX02_08840 [Sphingomonas sanxanigenens DSM 19645 = NX02]
MNLITMAAALLAMPIPALAAGEGEGVSLADFQAAGRQRLLRADANGDAKISKEEWAAGRKNAKRDPSRMFGRLDANGDGQLEASEIDTLLARRFKRLDANGDGMVMPEERTAGRKAADD